MNSTLRGLEKFWLKIVLENIKNWTIWIANHLLLFIQFHCYSWCILMAFNDLNCITQRWRCLLITSHFIRTRQPIFSQSSMQTWQLLHLDYMTILKLTQYVTKSKFMVIGGRNKLSQFNDIALVANNDQLENVTKFQYLGVIINSILLGMTTLNNYKVK